MQKWRAEIALYVANRSDFGVSSQVLLPVSGGAHFGTLRSFRGSRRKGGFKLDTGRFGRQSPAIENGKDGRASANSFHKQKYVI